MNVNFENLSKIDDIIKKLDSLTKKVSGYKRWLNVNETALYLGYSKEYIHKLKDAQFIENIHYYKKSGKLLFDINELDNWVTSATNQINSKEIANLVLKDLI